jgi:ribosomal protein L11 methyltransferase
VRAKDRKKRSGWTGNVRSRDVGADLRLVPYWERGIAASSRRQVIIDPGPSFGAGDHPTTIMALEFLETALAGISAETDHATVLDVGTGTGVLAIAAAILGAEFSVGLDIDEVAVYTARRNLALNGLQERKHGICPVELFLGRLDAVRGSFDLVMANLAAPTLLRLMPQVKQHVKRFLILSGIADAMVEQVTQAYASPDLTLLSRSQQDGWHGALFRAK